MAFWDDARNAVTHVVHEVGSGIKHAVQKAVEWTHDLFDGPGNLGRVVSIEREVPLLLAGTSQEWHAGAVTANSLAERTRGLSDRVLAVSQAFESAWTGQSAEAANAHVSKVGHVMDLTSATLAANADNVSGVASNFDYTRNSMVPLPAKPPEESFWDKLSPWATDTEDEIARYNAAAKRNHELYAAYATNTRQQGDALQRDYGDLGTFDGGDITITDGQSSSPQTASGKASHGGPQSHQGAAPAPGTTTPAPAAVASHPAASQPAQGGHDNGSGFSPSPRSGNDDETVAAGFTRPDMTNTGVPGLSPGVSPGSGPGTGTTPPTYPVGGPGYVERPGGGAGRTPGEAGKSANLPGGGKQTGIRGMTESPVHSGPAGAGRAGNRLSTATPGGMAPGGRGKPEEDKEHQRKYVLAEDTLFTEEDKKDVDPTTGLPPAPPTIGA
ncbi:hypothetical protein [Amycolatopsis sp. lyj-84]|uniref:hypothetical protein n=1 Tax=Amycolatopsis sp. lyj-84 TaxID=2789284 RepID=UPI00397AEF6F